MGLEIPEQQKLWSSFRLDLRQMLDSSFIALQWVFNKRWARFIKAGHPKPWIPCGFSPRTGGMHKIIKSILWGRKKGWKDVNIECNLFSCLLESSSCFIHNPLKLQKSCPTPGLFNQKQQGRNFPKKGRENCEAQNLPKKGSAGIFLKKKTPPPGWIQTDHWWFGDPTCRITGRIPIFTPDFGALKTAIWGDFDWRIQFVVCKMDRKPEDLGL